MYYKMVIFLDIGHHCCLRELFGDSWTKTLQCLVCQIEVSFICSVGIFSDRETLELLAVLKICFLVWSLLISALFVELFHFYSFVTVANVVDSFNHIFFLLGECHTLFPCVDCHTYPSIFQWNCNTALPFFWNCRPPCFLLFHTLPLCYMDCHTFLLLSEWNCPTYLCMNVTQIPCVSLWSLCECYTCVSVFFVWMSYKYPCVSISSKWALHFFLLMAHNWLIHILILCVLPHLFS